MIHLRCVCAVGGQPFPDEEGSLFSGGLYDGSLDDPANFCTCPLTAHRLLNPHAPLQNTKNLGLCGDVMTLFERMILTLWPYKCDTASCCCGAFISGALCVCSAHRYAAGHTCSALQRTHRHRVRMFCVFLVLMLHGVFHCLSLYM